MSNEIQLVSNKSYTIEDFKAFNYVFHGKRDTDVQIHNRNKKISRIDLRDLNRKVTNKLDKENIITNLFNLHLVLENGSYKEYSDWEVFDREDLQIKETTSYITMEYDFSVKLPIYALPQRHTLKIKIGGSLALDEVLKYAMSGKDEHELNELTADVVCKVDFINYALATELKNIVREWYDALPHNDNTNIFVRFVRSNFRKIQESFRFACISIGCFIIYFFAKWYFIIPKQAVDDYKIFLDYNLKIILLAGIIFYFSYSIGSLYQARISRKIISRLKGNPMLKITKGDENKIAEILTSNKKKLGNLLIQLIIALAANGITVIIGEILTKR